MLALRRITFFSKPVSDSFDESIQPNMSKPEELTKIIAEYTDKFQFIPSEDWNKRRAPGKWSKKEVLGHLIDSAANNLRRFIVTQYQPNQKIVYFQEEWVKFQN